MHNRCKNQEENRGPGHFGGPDSYAQQEGGGRAREGDSVPETAHCVPDTKRAQQELETHGSC